MPLLQIENLTVDFALESGSLRAVDGLSLSIDRGQALGVVGESGSGKSVSALAIMRLLDSQAQITSGRILFDGVDLLQVPKAEMRSLRGRRIAMIFQEPMTSLNPSYSIGEQLAEVYRYHLHLSRPQAKARAIEMLDRVKIAHASAMYDKYPHEFSGGMRQRVMIAMALACKPDLVIADEPTTALDVTIQAQILSVLQELLRETRSSLLFISHNLEVVAQVCDNVAVMYAGRLMEVSPTTALFKAPAHPYTEGLLRSLPRRGVPLYAIPGAICDVAALPTGCRFHPRCDHANERCGADEPRLELLPPELIGEVSYRQAACHFPLLPQAV